MFGLVPLGGIALLELGVIGTAGDETARLKLHAGLVGLFLVTAHVAMIAGMLDPAVLGFGADVPAFMLVAARKRPVETIVDDATETEA